MKSCKINSPHNITNKGVLFSSLEDRNHLEKFISNKGKVIFKTDNGNPNNKGYSYLDSLINKGKKDSTINLDYDIKLMSEEKELYENGIEIINDNLIVDGNGHCIDANFLGSIFSIHSKKIILRNIRFINTDFNGYGALNLDNSDLKLENCIFMNNSSLEGSCIKSEKSSIEVNSCKFIDNFSKSGGAINILESDLELNDCEFEKNSANNGGSIYFIASELNIVNCRFNNNKAHIGGAICQNYADKYSTLNIVKSIFSNNMDKNGGPSIYLCENLKTNILNSSFEENIKDVRYTGVDIINFSKNFRSSRDSMNLLKNCDFKGSEKNIIFNMSNLTLVGCNLKKHHKIKENGGKLIVLDNSDEFEDFNTLIHSGEKISS